MRTRLLSALALLGWAACVTTPAPVPREELAPVIEAPAAEGAPEAAPAPQGVVAEQKAPEKAPAPVAVVFTPQQLREQEDIFARAREASARKDYVQSERELKALLERQPQVDYAWTNLGIVHERQGQLPQAETSYRRALELKPGQEEANVNLTRLMLRTGRGADAERELRARLEASPEALGPRCGLVIVLLSQRKYEAAATEAKQVLKRDERNVRAMQLLAQVYHREKKYELARMVLENARAIAPI
jgi:tetratricopeptide (TPR) repeat protein